MAQQTVNDVLTLIQTRPPGEPNASAVAGMLEAGLRAGRIHPVLAGTAATVNLTIDQSSSICTGLGGTTRYNLPIAEPGVNFTFVAGAQDLTVVAATGQTLSLNGNNGTTMFISGVYGLSVTLVATGTTKWWPMASSGDVSQSQVS